MRTTDQPVTSWPNRGVRLAGRLLGNRLDRQLAQGTPPESSPFLTDRARRITSAAQCEALAADWIRLLDHAQGTTSPRSVKALLCRDRILHDRDRIWRLITVLSDGRPKSARWTAAARILLTDGAGPLYNKHSGTDLSSTLAIVTSSITAPSAAGTSDWGLEPAQR